MILKHIKTTLQCLELTGTASPVHIESKQSNEEHEQQINANISLPGKDAVYVSTGDLEKLLFIHAGHLQTDLFL